MALLSPVSRLSSMRGLPSSTTPSAGTWSPWASSTTSSRTTCRHRHVALLARAQHAHVLRGQDRQPVHLALRADLLEDAYDEVAYDHGHERDVLVRSR
jgi:hypothetical protein